MAESATLAVAPREHFPARCDASRVMLTAGHVDDLLVRDVAGNEADLILKIGQALRVIAVLPIIQILLFLLFFSNLFLLVPELALVRISPRQSID